MRIPDEAGPLALLELLAREEPRQALDGALDRARRSDPPLDAERLAALEAAHRLAVEVHTQLERRQQRGAGLSALVDTARDLTLPYEQDELLHLISRRARLLLNLDMAYVSLHVPEDGVSVVHAADGHASSLTVGFEVPAAAGLGADSAERAAPFWTPDYLPDERIRHSPVIDQVVRAEGLRAILAVPLRHGDHHYGVLYAADRNVRYFTPEELSLMSSLGDLAALAIEKTRRLDGVRAEADSLASDGARSRTDLARALQLGELRRRLLDEVLSGCSLHRLLALAAEELHGSLHLRGQAGDWLAGATGAPGLDEDLLLRASLDAHASATPVELPDGVLLAPVQAGKEHLGVLLLRRAPETGGPGSLDGATGQAADDGQSAGPGSLSERLAAVAQTAAVLLVMQRSTAVAEGSLRDDLLDDLLGDAPQEPQALRERALGLGLDPDAPHVVVVIRIEGAAQGRAVVWASSHAYRTGGLKTVREGNLTLLLPGDDPSAVAHRVAAELRPLLEQPPTVAAAGPVHEPGAVRRANEEAGRCLGALLALGAKGTAAAPSDLGFLGLLLSDRQDVDGFVRSAIGPVLDYDRQRSTELVRTLEAYFVAGGSPTYAAEALYVHPNTVSRRLERVTEILGPDWQSPAQSLEIQLALRLHRTRGSLGAG